MYAEQADGMRLYALRNVLQASESAFSGTARGGQMVGIVMNRTGLQSPPFMWFCSINDCGCGFAEVEAFSVRTEGQAWFGRQGFECLKSADNETCLYVASYHYGMFVQTGLQQPFGSYLRAHT
jgi:hypothetical protein